MAGTTPVDCGFRRSVSMRRVFGRLSTSLGPRAAVVGSEAHGGDDMSEGKNMSEQHVGPEATSGVVVQPRWFTVKEVARMLGYGETKIRMLVISGDLRSLKDGRARRILPEWVDEYVARRAAESESGR